MVCDRCKLVVRDTLLDLGIRPVSLELGAIEIEGHLTTKKSRQLADKLEPLGFAILDDQQQQLIEKIKTLLIQEVQSGALQEHFSLSQFLGKSLHRDYTALSRLFSQVEGITIEQFFILQKLEKVKEWLSYRELTLSEIAWKLGYSSVSHLSAQFKKYTGMTPTAMKSMTEIHRRSLDKTIKHKL